MREGREVREGREGGREGGREEGEMSVAYFPHYCCENTVN